MTRRCRRILFALVPAAIALAAIEVGVRASRPHEDLWELTGRRPGPSPLAKWAQLDAFCAYRARPGQEVVGSGVKTINHHGFISTPEIELAKKPATLRIAFLGGSSTAGTGYDLPDEETWPWKVSERLRGVEALRGRNVDFINGALGGFSSFESLGRLTHRIRFFRPDIVVLYHGWNEMYYFDDLERAHRWRTLSDGSWGFEPTTLTLIEPMSIDWIVWPSQLLTKVRRRLGRRVESSQGEAGVHRALRPGFDERTIHVWRENLRLTRTVCESIGAKLVVCKQATLIVDGLPAEQRARCRYERHGFDHDAHVRAFDLIYEAIDQEMPATNVIDVRPVSGLSENFADHIHPTEIGATRIAEIVFRGLCRLLSPN